MNANNNSGRNLKVEALTTVRQLERFLAKSVARQWYDMERLSFNFVQKVKNEGPLTFTYDVSIIHFIWSLLDMLVNYQLDSLYIFIFYSTILTRTEWSTSLEAMVVRANGSTRVHMVSLACGRPTAGSCRTGERRTSSRGHPNPSTCTLTTTDGHSWLSTWDCILYLRRTLCVTLVDTGGPLCEIGCFKWVLF